MKKPALIFLAAAFAAAAFAQGKVNVIGDTASPIVLNSEPSYLLAADQSLRGQPVGNATPLPSGIVLAAGLYGGTSPGNLFLYSFTLLNVAANPAGAIPAFHVVLNAQPNGAPAIPGIASGTPIGATTPWFQVRVWDSAYPTFEAARAAGMYEGRGAEFQLNPGPSLAYTFTAPAGANTTWQDGGIIVGFPTPEPSSLAVLLLGAMLVVSCKSKLIHLR